MYEVRTTTSPPPAGDERTKLEEGLRAALDLAREALAAAVDTLDSSRSTQRIAKRTIREAASTEAEFVIGPGSIQPDPASE